MNNRYELHSFHSVIQNDDRSYDTKKQKMCHVRV